MMRKPSCCPVEKERPTASACHGKSGQRKGFDLLFWGALLGISLLWVLGVFFAKEIAIYAWLAAMAQTVHHMVHAMWWGVVIGAIFVGLLSQVPREFILSILGKGGTFSGLLRATGAGVLLDLCSHGILMVAAKLYERGASAGQVIAFLLASPWNSFSLTLVLIGLIGWQWTVTFIVLSMVIALITGWIFDRLVASQNLPANHYAMALPEHFKLRQELKARLRNVQFNTHFVTTMAISGIKDSKMVVRWLLFGILLAAVLRATLDSTQFEQFFGPTILGLMITVLVAWLMHSVNE